MKGFTFQSTRHIVSEPGSSAQIGPILKALDGPDPLSFALLAAGKWLRDIKPKSEAQVALMRRLVALFQDGGKPAALRQAAIAALALSGDTAGATARYDDLLSLWKDADGDIPAVRKARAEYARLRD